MAIRTYTITTSRMEYATYKIDIDEDDYDRSDYATDDEWGEALEEAARDEMWERGEADEYDYGDTDIDDISYESHESPPLPTPTHAYDNLKDTINKTLDSLIEA